MKDKSVKKIKNLFLCILKLPSGLSIQDTKISRKKLEEKTFTLLSSLYFRVVNRMLSQQTLKLIIKVRQIKRNAEFYLAS